MSNPLSRARTPLWLRQLTPGFFPKDTPVPTQDPLKTAGRLLREARESKGLGLRELAQRTRISIAVLEALEGGWKDRLPEATYLRAMLPLLEQQLELPATILEPLLPKATTKDRGAAGLTGSQATPLSPGALQLLASWQSGLLYGLLVLGLLYGVNLQQKRLAAMGRLVAQPIPLTPTEGKPQDNPADPFPELRPLKQAARGQAMGLLGREAKQAGPDLSLGLLTLSLKQPTRMDLQSRRSGDTRLEGLAGNVSLPVLPPFELRLSPAPAPAAVRWRGQILQEKNPGASEKSSPESSTTALFVMPMPTPAKATAAAPTPP